jgi:apolipoprotein N-acyltransferase
MRAAETGRPVVQAAISGITGVIDAAGVLRGHTRLFDRTIFESTVAATGGQTPYMRYGEWALSASTIGVACTLLVALRRRRRKAALHSTAAAQSISVGARLAGYEPVSAKEHQA